MLLTNHQYLSVDTIEELHVEITNLCNAACPMCARNFNGTGLTPNPGWGSWKEGDSEKVFSPDLINLKRVFFCGTHGDPTMAPSLLESIEVCKKRNLQVSIYTNGSARSESWWVKLLSLLDDTDKIVFGIDGIETNHLYRQNTDINKILRHLEMCAKSRVKTQWDFLAFRHNEHEIEKSQQLATRLGVDIFTIRKTARFREDSYPVKNSEGEVTHLLQPPLNPELRHPNYSDIQQINRELPKSYKIECNYKKLRKIYVNSRLEVFPCCYISDENEMLRLNRDKERLQLPIESVNLNNNSWKQILDTPFYRDMLVKSFTGEDIIKRCIVVCGVVQRERNQEEIVWGN